MNLVSLIKVMFYICICEKFVYDQPECPREGFLSLFIYIYMCYSTAS